MIHEEKPIRLFCLGNGSFICQVYFTPLRRFVQFHNMRHPAEMAEQEISQYLTHLAVQGVR
ncbi:MAG: phage integrase N-terminal SAM-like domain-containing protein [bacterium]